MDVVESQGIKVPNSVLISGLAGTEVDEEVIEFLKTYGSISRVVKVDSSDPEFKNTAIVEFQFGTAIEALQDELPLRKATSNPSITHDIQLLSTLYSTKLTSSLTQSYLTDLKGVAKVSGADYERILLEELSKIQKSTESKGIAPFEEPTEAQTPLFVSDTEVVASLDPVPAQISQVDYSVSSKSDIPPPTLNQGFKASPAAERPDCCLSTEQISTPEVQRVVVEHIVKSQSQAYQGSSKFRPFSGKNPCPNLEVDYETWRSNVDFYLADPTVPERQVVRKIIESLLAPAANIVKHLGPLSRPLDFLSLLDSAYGTVDDVDELFAKYLNTNQNAGEKPSVYLHRLQSTLSKVVKGGGIAASDSDRQLLKQFCRGCWNNSLITSLQLEQKKSNPPPFSELLLLLRTEEDKQAAKSNRMKQHLGFSKLKVQSNPQSVYSDTGMSADDDDTTLGVTMKLQKQVARLQAQLTTLKASMDEPLNRTTPTKAPKAKKGKPKETAKSLPQSSANFGKSNRRPRPWYCFNCGEDGHIAPSCTNDPNPDVVEAKRKELKEKQRSWDEQNTSDLN
ncbi:uncharacterized protein LOC117826384 [Notolabrus celidotus]|uniref:uncharacterized protein LOC117806658 n=1 Tax=Notolabrus celidotus TaxID=1203425 RepID=UPI00148FD8C1|nr:uncharacterized protein LOC117806658 [Notolabrus celidotus]XP_034558278.1 uncharacterized protein LOC117826384 [Notolabrus celidotus]